MSYTYSKYRKTTPFIFDDTDPFEEKFQRLDIKKHLKNEFLKSDPKTFNKMLKVYGKLHGAPAKNYMQKTVEQWRAGTREMSDQTVVRILEIIPRFLTDAQRFYILQHEVVYYFNSMQYYHQNKSESRSVLGVNMLFINYYHQIRKFDTTKLSWFIDYGIFTEKELESFLVVCFSALRRLLNLNCRQVFNDLQMIKNKLTKYNIEDFDGSYYINFLDTYIDISVIKTARLKEMHFEAHEPEFYGVFQEFTKAHYWDEMRKMDNCRKEGERYSFIKSNDLEVLFNHYQKSVKQKTQFRISSSFQGEGGILAINLLYAPITTFIEIITVPSLKILVLLLFESAFLYLWFMVNTLGDNVLGFFGGLLVMALICVELVRIKNSVLQLKRNG